MGHAILGGCAKVASRRSWWVQACVSTSSPICSGTATRSTTIRATRSGPTRASAGRSRRSAICYRVQTQSASRHQRRHGASVWHWGQVDPTMRDPRDWGLASNQLLVKLQYGFWRLRHPGRSSTVSLVSTLVKTLSRRASGWNVFAASDLAAARLTGRQASAGVPSGVAPAAICWPTISCSAR